MWQLTMFHIVAAIDTYSKSASWIPARSHIWSNFVIGSLVSCLISHLIIAGMVPALSATSDNPSSESETGQSYLVVCLCNIDIENWFRHRMADVTNPKTCLGYLGMVNPPQFLEESDQGKGRGGKDTCSAPQLYNLSHDKTSVPINPNKQTNNTCSTPPQAHSCSRCWKEHG